VASMGLRVLKTPVRTPQANAFCECLVGTIRRECLDWLIPLNERHLRRILREWVTHLQSGPSACQLRSGNPRGISRTELAGCRRPSRPCAMPSGRDAHSRWTASRVSLGARGRVMVASILRTTGLAQENQQL
jgi:hypothetical protein